MKLGDFFSSATTARASNPRPVTFTAIAKGGYLPGGTANPHKVPVAAKVTACFLFLGGDGFADARVDARKALRMRYVDPETKFPVPTDDDDFNIELTYHVLWRALREWDPNEKRAVDRLFPDVQNIREMVEPSEANRVMKLYNEYVKDEHPEEAVNAKTFRGAEGGSKGAPHK